MHRQQSEPALDATILEELRALSGDGDGDLLAELIDLFVEDSPNHLAALAEAVEGADATSLRSVAHSLKSSASYLGALQLAELCRELEQLAGESRLERAGELVERAQAEYRRVHGALQSIRS